MLMLLSKLIDNCNIFTAAIQFIFQQLTSCITTAQVIQLSRFHFKVPVPDSYSMIYHYHIREVMSETSLHPVLKSVVKHNEVLLVI